MQKRELTYKQTQFVELYLNNGFNGSKAYQLAYQTSNKGMAKVEAYRLLQQQKIIDRIEELERSFRQLARENELDRVNIVLELKRIIEIGNNSAKLAAINTICHLVGDLPYKPAPTIEEDEEEVFDISKMTDEEKEEKRRYLMETL